jgi:hypothetical protein
MRRIPTKYYQLITDVSPDEAREAAVRMDAMAEEYHQRTRDFSGVIRQRLPLYLFRTKEDYLAAGGLPGSAGMYVSDGRLLAVGGDHLDDRTWHIVQHEGFHQFAAAVIGGERPPWLNEGLAEYFGEALFTGDGFITGVIPNWRMQRVRSEMAAKKFMPLDRFMQLGQDQWNADINALNYDEAWSLVQFLAHGEDGRYQHAFASLLIALSKNKPFPDAWRMTMGSTNGLEDRWQQEWSRLPENPTQDLYVQATVARLTSFLARAAFQQQQFADFDDFLAYARNGSLKSSPDQWLPPRLLTDATTDADDLVKSGAVWSLVKDHQAVEIRCKVDEKVWVGTYQLRNSGVTLVDAHLVK